MPDETLLKKAPYHFDEVYNFALRMTGSYRKASQLTLHIISEAAKFYEFHEPDDLRKWLLGIAVNIYNSSYKTSLKNNGEQIDSEFFSNESPIDKIYIEDKFRSISEKDLFKIIAQLPPDYKMVLVLKEVLNLDYNTIAEIVNIPDGTVVRRLNRARKLIYIQIINHYG